MKNRNFFSFKILSLHVIYLFPYMAEIDTNVSNDGVSFLGFKIHKRGKRWEGRSVTTSDTIWTSNLLGPGDKHRSAMKKTSLENSQRIHADTLIKRKGKEKRRGAFTLSSFLWLPSAQSTLYILQLLYNTLFAILSRSTKKCEKDD